MEFEEEPNYQLFAKDLTLTAEGLASDTVTILQNTISQELV